MLVQQFSMSDQLLHHLLEVAPAMMSLFKAEEERTEQWVWWCHPGHHFRGMDTSSCWGKTCGRAVATDAFAPSPLKMTWCPWRSCGRQRLCPVPRPGQLCRGSRSSGQGGNLTQASSSSACPAPLTCPRFISPEVSSVNLHAQPQAQILSPGTQSKAASHG